MKWSARAVQIALIVGTLILISGLIWSPRLSKEVREGQIKPDALRLQQAIAEIQNGQNPMKGIAMMQDLLKEDSTNVQVHWYLAQFSLTSQQIENAEFRFEKVIQFDTDSHREFPQAYFWLAQVKLELDKDEEAIPLLEKYLTLETDSVVVQGVEQMIERIKEHIH